MLTGSCQVVKLFLVRYSCYYPNSSYFKYNLVNLINFAGISNRGTRTVSIPNWGTPWGNFDWFLAIRLP